MGENTRLHGSKPTCYNQIMFIQTRYLINKISIKRYKNSSSFQIKYPRESRKKFKSKEIKHKQNTVYLFTWLDNWSIRMKSSKYRGVCPKYKECIYFWIVIIQKLNNEWHIKVLKYYILWEITGFVFLQLKEYRQ